MAHDRKGSTLGNDVSSSERPIGPQQISLRPRGQIQARIRGLKMGTHL